MSMSSAIILFCIKPNTGCENLTAADFLATAQVIGEPQTIIIFSRKTIVKLFVQFVEKSLGNDALAIAQAIDCPFGKMQAFFSDKPSIRCEQNDPADYWLADGLQTTLVPPIATQDRPAIGGSVPSRRIGSCSAYDQLSHLETSTNPLPPPSRSMLPSLSNTTSVVSPTVPVTPSQFLNSHPLDHPSIQLPSNILLIRNFDPKDLQASQLATLLFTWGHVREILVSKKHHLAFASFHTPADAAIAAARRELAGLKLSSAPLLPETVNDIHPKYIPTAAKPDSHLYIWRSPPQQFITSLAPNPAIRITRYLLVSDASPFLSELALTILVAETARPNEIRWTQRVNRSTFIMELGSLPDSVRTLAILQGQRLDASRLSLTFLEWSHVQHLISQFALFPI